MLLRAARLPDLPALLDVQEAGAVLALHSIFPQDTHPFPRADLERRWAAEIAHPDIDVHVIERIPGRIEGFVAIRGAELLHFGTAVDTWGTGLAAGAHAEIVAKLEAPAFLRVFEENHRARRFYEKMGWRRTAWQSRSSFAPHPVLLRYELDLDL
ncbi:GNAT family N-acetyltransferase [Paractinoplanes rishiriensis]|uniref:N-acetyltransferase domain-containing protein n=1 Tax=Paractinoplanes rishiriensis TaxID=1050105 RepID=A0A919MU29_9ACTN|nr:GNAT family protein [Actinoplanes rishiriensis]GIE95363.1 hypothetical protein Ari01nite_28280 [Actinoplanes rishiriensis]